MSIGELMSKEYSLRYARDFLAFMNPVEVPASYPRLSTQRSGDAVRFVYVGGLHLGRAECLAEIASVLQGLKNEGCPVAFDVYAPEHDADSATRLEAIGDVVAYRGSVRPEAVGNVLSESDIAVHVESFSSECAEYTRLSVSTKIPQYFAAGIPVLAYGPSGLASCRYVRSSGAGVLVDQRGVAHWARLFEHLRLKTIPGAKWGCVAGLGRESFMRWRPSDVGSVRRFFPHHKTPQGGMSLESESQLYFDSWGLPFSQRRCGCSACSRRW